MLSSTTIPLSFDTPHGRKTRTIRNHGKHTQLKVKPYLELNAFTWVYMVDGVVHYTQPDLNKQPIKPQDLKKLNSFYRDGWRGPSKEFVYGGKSFTPLGCCMFGECEGASYLAVLTPSASQPVVAMVVLPEGQSAFSPSDTLGGNYTVNIPVDNYFFNSGTMVESVANVLRLVGGLGGSTTPFAIPDTDKPINFYRTEKQWTVTPGKSRKYLIDIPPRTSAVLIPQWNDLFSHQYWGEASTVILTYKSDTNAEVWVVNHFNDDPLVMANKVGLLEAAEALRDEGYCKISVGVMNHSLATVNVCKTFAYENNDLKEGLCSVISCRQPDDSNLPGSGFTAVCLNAEDATQ